VPAQQIYQGKVERKKKPRQASLINPQIHKIFTMGNLSNLVRQAMIPVPQIQCQPPAQAGMASIRKFQNKNGDLYKLNWQNPVDQKQLVEQTDVSTPHAIMNGITTSMIQTKSPMKDIRTEKYEPQMPPLLEKMFKRSNRVQTLMKGLIPGVAAAAPATGPATSTTTNAPSGHKGAYECHTTMGGGRNAVATPDRDQVVRQIAYHAIC